MMKNYKFIPNRLTNLAGTMPMLKVDFSIDNRRRTQLTTMLPINIEKGNFDILVSGYKIYNENVTIFPFGILGNSEHLLFPRANVGDQRRLTAWVGKVCCVDYSISISYLEVARCAPFLSKDFRNLNKIAGMIYKAYSWSSFQEYAFDEKYAGHKFLNWY